MTVHKLSLKYGLDVKIIGVAVLYYLAARLGYFLAFHDSVALPAWPPSGVAFALTILLGRQVWPGIMIGSLVANILAFWNTGVMAPQSIIYISSCIAIGNTLEAVTGTLLLRTWIDSNHLFRQTRNAFRFLFTVVLMCLVGASMATISLFTNEAINSEVLAKTFFSGWIGNVVGILLFTPLILSAAQKLDFKLSTKKSIEMGIFFVCVLSVFLLLQIEYLAISLERALPFLILPFLLWLAFRFDLIVAMIGVVSASLVSIYFTNAGIGPFVLEQSEHAMWLLQIFISVLSASTIILSATVKERLIVQRKLEEFNENLESMVEQRTKALNEEIKIRRAAEKKLQGTNEELFKRNTELDNFVYSVSHDLRAPIASVLGLINLAKMDDDVTMKDMYLDMINNSALQQDIFIKEILDQSRNSRLELKREPVCFASLIDETFSQLKFATTTGKSVDKMISVKQDQEF
jgi:integral membrane sensor domain MASE1